VSKPKPIAEFAAELPVARELSKFEKHLEQHGADVDAVVAAVDDALAAGHGCGVVAAWLSADPPDGWGIPTNVGKLTGYTQTGAHKERVRALRG
jgi:hypothetical protein